MTACQAAWANAEAGDRWPERVTVQNNPEPPPIKHCCVTDAHGRLPALLLERRQTEADWQGRAVRPVLEDDAWVVVEVWLPAGLLDPT